jgi:hypothetical protein
VNLLKRHWLIASLVVVGIAVFAAFRFTKENPQPCENNSISPSCTFVSFVVNCFSSPHQITAVTSPNSIDDV